MLTGISALALLAVTAWVVAPLFSRGSPPEMLAPDDKALDLLEAKEAVYRSILDLEFDRKMGKVSEEDYGFMRGQHEAEALQILAEIDDATWTTDTLEREIAAARKRLRK